MVNKNESSFPRFAFGRNNRLDYRCQLDVRQSSRLNQLPRPRTHRDLRRRTLRVYLHDHQGVFWVIVGYVRPAHNLHKFSLTLSGDAPKLIPHNGMNMDFRFAPGDRNSEPVGNRLEEAIERIQPA